jgi:serine/threonine-protein kinase
LSIEETVECVVHACEPVALAHAAGIVHRDLKPGNLFRVERADGTPCIKVLDFGISKFFASTDPTDFSMTRSRVTMGSPLYVAPEQMSSARDVDARTDIWALGVILFELLTGVPPFQGEDIPQLCAQILQSPPLPLRTLRPDVPERLEAIVLRCLAKDRAQRFERVGELAEVLSEFAPTRARSIAERVVQIGAAELAHAATLPSSPPNRASVPAVRALQRPPSVRVATRFVPAPLESIPSPMARTRDGTDGRDSLSESGRPTRWITLGVAVAAVATLGVAWRVRQGADLSPAMAADLGRAAAQAPAAPMVVAAAPVEVAASAVPSVQSPHNVAETEVLPRAPASESKKVSPGGRPSSAAERKRNPNGSAAARGEGSRHNTPSTTALPSAALPSSALASSALASSALAAPPSPTAGRTGSTPIPDDRK